MTKGPIAVVGATGYTGGRVLASLARRGVSVRLVGRNLERLTRAADGLEGAEVRAVTSWEAEPLGQALEGCAAVISCAGPFIRAGRPVVAGALRARVPYTDSTGEQSFIRHVFDDLHRPAREARLPLVPAFGFDYVPGDLGAALAASELGPLERIDV
ncbi:MAG: NAD(P)H-binding protein, partial [Chloroflexi bacterium]|nr:NAD(P)H-binding protein [Chloroflexota bacterium]